MSAGEAGRVVGDQRALPRQRVARGVLERAEAQARRERARDAHGVDAVIAPRAPTAASAATARRRAPSGTPRPPTSASATRRPRAAMRSRQLPQRQRLGGPDGVERARDAALQQRQHELRQVAHVDDLHGHEGSPGASTSPPRAMRRGQYGKRSVVSCGPTISPGRTIKARAPNASRTALFTQYFKCTVSLTRDGPRRSGRRARQRRGLVAAARDRLRVDRDAGDEQVLADGPARAHAPTRRPARGTYPRRIHHRVPVPPRQRRQPAITIAGDALDPGDAVPGSCARG